MSDAFDLSTAIVHRSPDVSAWPATVAIRRIVETTRGGFELFFDRALPDAWKWPSNPDVPSDNFQFTVWAFVPFAGRWHGAGFVQMWQGREMGTGALPAIFAVNDGVPGYINWWGDPRKLWGTMSDYVPQPGDTVGFMVSAGNARLWDGGVSSVAERSNVVLFPLVANDQASVDYEDAPVPDPPAPTPEPVSPDLAPIVARFEALEQRMTAHEATPPPICPPLPDYEGTGRLFGFPIKVRSKPVV